MCGDRTVLRANRALELTNAGISEAAGSLALARRNIC